MKYIRKLWLRIIISLVAGGMVSEIITMRSGNTNQPTLFFIAIIFIFLSLIVFLTKLKYFFFSPKDEDGGREDILDD